MIRQSTRLFSTLGLALLILCQTSSACLAAWQIEQPTELINGDFEASEDNDTPVGWFFSPALTQRGYEFGFEIDSPHEGERAAMISSLQADRSGGRFGNLMQTLDATPWRGKRVRFRAAVRTAELADDGKAQLWFRVDRTPKNGQPSIGAFDNMNDRPITQEDWDYYEIVATIDDDAETIVIGLLLLGEGKAWMDDASFLEVDESVEETTMDVSTQASSSASGGTGDASAPQPFWSPWLLFVPVTLGLFVISQLKISDSYFGYVQRFALRFTLFYWLLYSLPAPITTLVPYYGYQAAAPYQTAVDSSVRWTAKNVLSIEQPLVAPNGSGDTTYDFIRVLLCFAFAFVLGLLWSLVDWRKTDHRIANDLLRSYVRYVLAFTMLGYGLAKVGFAMNQFPEPSMDRLMQSYGDSSPMGLVWTFMGASRTYTIFAGLGEVIGALLLIWRRTALLGAFVIIGVMTNVVMLNFCYDVPVKQYSGHLLGMACFLALIDLPRLFNLFIRNRNAEPADFHPPYTGRRTVWVQRTIKAAIIVIGIAFPIYQKVQMERNYVPFEEGQPEFYGTYVVESFTRAGEEVPPLTTDGSRWDRVSIRKTRRFEQNQIVVVDYLSVRMMNEIQFASQFELSPDETELDLTNASPAVPQKLRVREVDKQHIIIDGGTNANSISITLRRLNREDFLLVNRGFRWINEYPFNR